MKSVFTRLGAALVSFLLVSAMPARAAEETGTAAVYFKNQSNLWYKAYFYIKKPGSPNYVESPTWHSTDGSGFNENLPENSLVCVSVRTGGLDGHLRPLFKKYIFNVTKQGEHSFLYFYGGALTSYYGFGGPKGAGDTQDDRDAQKTYNQAGLVLVKELTAPGICNAT